MDVIIDDEKMVLSEKSLFRTRVPRSTNMTLHLVIWVLTLCGSMLAAVLSAHYYRNSEKFPANTIAIQRMKINKVEEFER